MRHWTEIEPKDAVDIVLPRDDIIGPINELGEPCPWPWDPQQLEGAPMGQYHCPYCGGMQMAGLPHLDWAGVDMEEMFRDGGASDRRSDGGWGP